MSPDNDAYLSEDDADLDTIVTLVCVAARLAAAESADRGVPVPQDRIVWETHCLKSVSENSFQRKYRMGYVSFSLLVEQVRPFLSYDVCMLTRTGLDPICVESRLAMTLRYISGASYLDCMDSHGVSRA